MRNLASFYIHSLQQHLKVAVATSQVLNWYPEALGPRELQVSAPHISEMGCHIQGRLTNISKQKIVVKATIVCDVQDDMPTHHIHFHLIHHHNHHHHRMSISLKCIFPFHK